MKTISFILVFIGFIASGGFAQADGKNEKTIDNNSKPIENIQPARRLIESGNFEFDATMALPMTGGSVNLSSGQNFLRIDGEMAESALPFFGESHQADLTGDGGIQFKAKMTDYKAVNNEKKGQYKISFKVSDGKDHYDIFMDSYYDGRSSLRIGSYNKSAMSYYGYLTKISRPGKKKFEK